MTYTPITVAPMDTMTFSCRAEGEPNKFRIIATDHSRHPDDLRHTDWLAAIQLNGDLRVSEQAKLMQVLTEAAAKFFNHVAQ